MPFIRRRGAASQAGLGSHSSALRRQCNCILAHVGAPVKFFLTNDEACAGQSCSVGGCAQAEAGPTHQPQSPEQIIRATAYDVLC